MKLYEKGLFNIKNPMIFTQIIPTVIGAFYMKIDLSLILGVNAFVELR